MGIQRTIFICLPKAPSSHAIVFPAAMLITTVSAETASFISAMTSERNCGFTASTRMSAASATSLLVFLILTPYLSAIFSLVAEVLAVPIISSAFTMFFFSMPDIIASAIFPSPINPIFMLVYLFSFICSFHIRISFSIYPQVKGKKSNFLVPICFAPSFSYHLRSFVFSSTMPMFTFLHPFSAAVVSA